MPTDHLQPKFELVRFHDIAIDRSKIVSSDWNRWVTLSHYILGILTIYFNEIDFYTGFEGEPELIFLQKTVDCENKFRLWEGYFDTMMQQVSLSSNSEWTDLAYYYHLCLGCWGEETENW